MNRRELQFVGIALTGLLASLPCLAQCQVAKLLPGDGRRDDLFSFAVAIDRGRVVVGAPLHDHLSENDGGAYIFGAEVWSLELELATEGRGTGWAVGSAGDVVVLSSPNPYLVFLLERVGQDWKLMQSFRGADTVLGDFFGWSLAFDGDTIVVGAPEDDNENGARAGSAYVFARDPNGLWVETARLIASDGSPVDGYTESLAVHSDLIVVGAPNDDPFGFNSGSAYVYERDASGGWVETAKLLPHAGHSLQSFGQSVATSGHVILVGAPGDISGAAGTPDGAVYAFEPDESGAWTQRQKIAPETLDNSDNFGWSVAIDGALAVVGAYADDGTGPESGAAYVFTRAADGSWSQLARLQPGDLGERDRFGRSVALSGNLAVVGAPYQDALGEDSGAAYVFAVSGDADGDGFMDACLCLGDVDGDFTVGMADLGIVLANFNARDLPDDPACKALWPTRCAGDLDRDADVDIDDLGLLLAHYGDVCP